MENPKSPPPTTGMPTVDAALVEESTTGIIPSVGTFWPSVRSAHFLLPRAGDAAPCPALPPSPSPAVGRGVRAEFKGWACHPHRWCDWVAALRPRHEPLWREAGILDAVLAGTCPVRWRRRNERVLLQLAAFWSGAGANTFAFPWGEATITLEDVAALAGLPLLGAPFRAPSDPALEEEVAAIEAVRVALSRRKGKKASYGAWVKHFLNLGGGGGELVEHGAFLAMWLSISVLPAPPFNVVRREVLPLAARLARGQSVALAPAALASIYSDLSALKRHITAGNRKEESLVLSAPLHILQLWVWERFPQLRPAAAAAADDHDAPRAARWIGVAKKFHSKHIRAVFMSPKELEWRPYGDSIFSLPAKSRGCWFRGQDTEKSKELLSFALCLHACELVGMNCIERYNPHRVARQLGFDQDVPGTVACMNSDWEKSWEAYNIEVGSYAIFVPKHKPGVTVQYARWWKPYSSRCDTAVANVAKMKEDHISAVSPLKRKMEGLPATNTGKKLHVDTAPCVRPPQIAVDRNLFSSHSSGGWAARRQAAAAPGLVLRSCAPHLRFKAGSAAPTRGMSQADSDAVGDLQDNIPLAERLKIIRMMRNPQTAGGLVKGVEQEQIVGSVKSSIPQSASVGAKKAVLHKNIEQALSDAMATSAIIVDESSGLPVTKKTQGNLEGIKEDDLNITTEEHINRTENGDALLPNVVQGAVITESNLSNAVAMSAIIVGESSGLPVTKKTQGNLEGITITTEEHIHTTENGDALLPNVVQSAASTESNLPNAVATSSIIVGESSGLPVTKKTQGNLEGIKEDDLTITAEEHINRAENGDALLPNVVQGAVSTESNLSNAVATSAIVVGESSGFPVTKKTQGNVERIEEDNLKIIAEEHINRTENGDALLPNVVQDAVSTESNEATGAATEDDMPPTLEDIVDISDDDTCDKENSEQNSLNTIHMKSNMSGTKASVVRDGSEGDALLPNVIQDAVSTESNEATGAATEDDMPPTLEDIVDISDDDTCDKEKSEQNSLNTMHMKSNMSGTKASVVRDGTEGYAGNIIIISDTELDEETDNEVVGFNEAESKEDAMGIVHLKSPKMETTECILQQLNEEMDLASKRNGEQYGQVLNENLVQNSHDCELASVPNIIRQGLDVLTHSATVQTNFGPLTGPTEEMHTCIVAGEVDNRDNVQKELIGSLDHNVKGNEDILRSSQEVESPVETSAGANRKRSGDSQRPFCKLGDGNTQLVSSEVCTKTLYCLSQFDLAKDDWDKDSYSTGEHRDAFRPKRAVGTMEMIKKASAIRQAEITELKKKIHDLKQEVLALEAAE